MARAVLAALLAAVLLAPSGALAAKRKPRSIFQSPLLWATVNVCDTPGNPDTIGIRGSIPGSGRARERMFLRFQVQYFDTADRLWHNILEGADSGFVDVGSARFRARQAGWSFKFVPPAGGGTHRLRGAVTFEWRVGDEVVRRARKRTRSGHRSAAGADPAGFTASVCEIS